MNELDKLLVEVDKIEDDDKWLEAESFESWIEFKEMMEE